MKCQLCEKNDSVTGMRVKDPEYEISVKWVCQKCYDKHNRKKLTKKNISIITVIIICILFMIARVA